MAKNEILGNLVWIDLEMTGLNVATDVILEIACIITDGNLNILDEGLSYVIHQPEENLAAMGQWCRDQHAKTGLTDAVRKSTITLQTAEKEIFALITKYCAQHTGVLAGNTVWQDRTFLAAYMPTITDYLHYRLIDVTSIKELIKRWYGKENEYKKSDQHRALGDIQQSIAELKYYRERFFKL